MTDLRWDTKWHGIDIFCRLIGTPFSWHHTKLTKTLAFRISRLSPAAKPESRAYWSVDARHVQHVSSKLINLRIACKSHLNLGVSISVNNYSQPEKVSVPQTLMHFSWAVISGRNVILLYIWAVGLLDILNNASGNGPNEYLWDLPKAKDFMNRVELW